MSTTGRGSVERRRRAGRGLWVAAWITSLVLLGGLLWVALHFDETKRFLDLVRHIGLGWTLAAAGLQGATYVCAAAAWQRALAAQRVRRPLLSLIPLALAKLFTDQILPSAGLSGTVLVVRGLRRRAVARKTAAAAVVMGLAGFYLASGVIVLATLALMWLGGDLNRKIVWLATPFLFLSAAMPLSLLWIRGRHGGRALARLRRLGPLRGLLQSFRGAPTPKAGNRRMLLEITAFQLGVFLLDAATLGAALWAVGGSAPPTSLVVSFVIAFLVGTVTLLPGGLGSFDATCVAMLHWSGVPFDKAITATLVFRGFTLLLPLLPGLWLTRREMA